MSGGGGGGGLIDFKRDADLAAYRTQAHALGCLSNATLTTSHSRRRLLPTHSEDADWTRLRSTFNWTGEATYTARMGGDCLRASAHSQVIGMPIFEFQKIEARSGMAWGMLGGARFCFRVLEERRLGA